MGPMYAPSHQAAHWTSGVFLSLRHANLEENMPAFRRKFSLAQQFIDLNVPGPQCRSSEELCCVSILRLLGEGMYYHYIKEGNFYLIPKMEDLS